MQNFIKSGGGFLLLAILFMVVAVMVEKPAVYIGVGAMWLILGLAMAAKHKKQSSSNQHKDVV
jgi:hypothetical protein